MKDGYYWATIASDLFDQYDSQIDYAGRVVVILVEADQPIYEGLYWNRDQFEIHEPATRGGESLRQVLADITPLPIESVRTAVHAMTSDKCSRVDWGGLVLHALQGAIESGMTPDQIADAISKKIIN